MLHYVASRALDLALVWAGVASLGFLLILPRRRQLSGAKLFWYNLGAWVCGSGPGVLLVAQGLNLLDKTVSANDWKILQLYPPLVMILLGVISVRVLGSLFTIKPKPRQPLKTVQIETESV